MTSKTAPAQPKIRLSKAIIMMVVRTGKMKINFFKKDPQAVSGGTGTT